MKEAMFHGVRTGVIHPGFVDTPLLQGMPEGYVEQNILPDTHLGRLIRPEEKVIKGLADPRGIERRLIHGRQ